MVEILDECITMLSWLLSIVLLFSTILANGQSCDLLVNYPTSLSSNLSAAAVHNDGSYVIAGNKTDSTGEYYLFVELYDSQDALIWSKRITRVSTYGYLNKYRVAIDNSKNVIIGFTFSGNWECDGITFYDQPEWNTCLLKLSSTDGSNLSHRSFGGNGIIVLHDLLCDPENNVIASGKMGKYAAFDSANIYTGNTRTMYVVKLNQNLDVLWLNNLEPDVSAVTDDSAIDVDSEGNVYGTGMTKGNTYLDSFYFPGYQYNEQVLVFKLSSEGHAIWARLEVGAGEDVPTDIAVSDDGFVYATGVTWSPYLVASPLMMQSNGGSDWYIIKYDTAGVPQWMKNGTGSGNEYGYQIEISDDGLIYFSHTDYLVSILDPDGNLITQVSSAGLYSTAFELVNSSQILFTGYYSYQLSMCNTIINGTYINGVYGKLSFPVLSNINIAEETNLEYSIYPNLVQNTFNLLYNSLENGNVQVFACDGKLTSSFIVKENQKIDCSDWAPGVYFIRVVSQNKVRTTKVIKL